MGNVIIPFGKPGAGKGTQVSKFLKGREERYESLSVGNILRKEVKEQTEIGRKAKSFMDAGKLVPDEIIIEMMVGKVKNSNKTVFLDGFPRTKGQAEAMLKAGIIPDMVIEFDVEDEVVIQRAKDRIVCSNCGEPYTTNKFKRPKTEGVCDICSGKLIKRKDDDELVVKKRLEVYKEETDPVLLFFKKEGISINVIDGTSEQASEIFEILVLN